MNLLVVLTCPAILALAGPTRWLPRAGRRWCAVLAATLLAGLVATSVGTATSPDVDGLGRVLLGAVAVVGGGPVVAVLLDGLEQPGEEPATVLRGGAWIGVLERASVYLAVAAGFPEAVAIVVAVKGLGRYPELQSDGGKGAAERFIAGTLASLLWAGSCALLSLR